MTIWVLTGTAWAVGGVFTWLSLFMTCHQIYKHLYHYTQPQFQLWIFRILVMVPIYAFSSWLSLKFSEYSVYFDTVRNCYEAFVIYSFLSLCLNYVGGESSFLHALTGRQHTPSCVTFTCCCKPFPYTVRFLRFCKRATLQFCAIKPLLSLVTIVLEAKGLYAEGDLNPRRGYLYVAIVYNISIGFALVGLLLFYAAAKDFLRPHKPLLKFIIVKSVIFLAFWQGVALAICEKVGLLESEEQDAGAISAAYQSFIICIEMFFVSILHLLAFPWKPFILDDGMDQPLGALQRVSTNLRSTLNPSDIVKDARHNFSSRYGDYHQATGHDNALEEDGDSDADAVSVTESDAIGQLNASLPTVSDLDNISLHSFSDLRAGTDA
eukprot:m.79943 g.79943  ORF g.79943 m.79943 type:complete len:379 (-) comp12585_c0_seq1:374-1510(-)